ncbi:MAG: fibronectin type III domain-containing protein [Stagnimonas sp.]|nr:fibronectin type III domain-containing protein [Stagnimonas sp.]
MASKVGKKTAARAGSGSKVKAAKSRAKPAPTKAAAKSAAKQRAGAAMTTERATASPAVGAQPAVGRRSADRAARPPRGDVDSLLRLALVKDLNSAEGKAALKAAQAAALRNARALRGQSTRLGLSRGETASLQRNSDEALFRAVLARELPNIAGKLRALKALPPPKAAPALPLLPLPGVPGTPTNPTAAPLPLSARVDWTPADALATSFKVLTRIGGNTVATTTVAGTPPHTALITGLTPGTSYTFRVRAANLAGLSAESVDSNSVTPTGLPVPTPGVPLDLSLPLFSSAPALLMDPLAEAARNFAAGAANTASTWRYEHLKAQALIAARESLAFDAQIARLMQLATTKLGAAEGILNDTLLAAAGYLKNTADLVGQAATAPAIDDVLKELGDTAAQSLVLPLFLAWLVEKGPLNFWIGLFEAMLCDLAAVVPIFGSATTFGRTGSYLGRAFDSDLDGLRSTLVSAVEDIRSRLDAEVEAMVAPLRSAVAAVTSGTSQAMADVFEGFDLPLTQSVSATPGAPDVANVDPFRGLYERLNAQVDALAATIKANINTALNKVLDATDNGLLRKLIIGFICIPLLAILIISLAGGPFSAALLAAVVLVAAEELIRLLVRWLTGPLLNKVTELKNKLMEQIGRLQSFFALQSQLVRNSSPEDILEMVASELRNLRDFLPQTFLDESAALLAEARSVIVNAANQLGLAAEQALGRENATAFEVLKAGYLGGVSPAPAPGGAHPEWLAGSALLRDLNRLEQQRTGLLDGKELEFTHRISLSRLLGGATEFTAFRLAREAVVELTQLDLIDRSFPGVYRALIKDVRVHGVFAGLGVGGAPLLGSVPVTLTHLGESRTRIRLRSNPGAPPLALPVGLALTAEAWAALITGELLTREVAAALDTVPTADIEELQAAFFLLLLLLLILGVTDAVTAAIEALAAPYRQACLEQVPAAVGRLAAANAFGVVPTAALEAGASTLLERIKFGPLLGFTATGVDIAGMAAQIAAILRDGIFGLPVLSTAARVRPGFPPFDLRVLLVRGLRAIAIDAWQEGTAAFRQRIARWGDATLEEDTDPQVRALGFATLVRREAPESTVFNLLPGDGLTAPLRADPGLGPSDGPPLHAPSTLQYRPLENRGLAGAIQLRMEGLGDDLLPQLSDTLSDLVLQVTVRGCYDESLARTVRASRRQTAAALGMVAGATGLSLAQPGALPRVDAGVSELRTVHYSLRAHRDKTLQIWNIAIAAQPALASLLGPLAAGKTALGRDQPFQPLEALGSFTLELGNAPLASTGPGLRGLVQRLRIGPGDLGFDAGVLGAGRNLLAEARLVALGVAVIPMPGAVRGEADPDTVDALNLRLAATAPLDRLLPGFAGGGSLPLPQRLKMTPIASPPNAPLLSELFGAGTTLPGLVLTLPPAEQLSDATNGLYDVIFSLSYRVPLRQAGSRIGALM